MQTTKKHIQKLPRSVFRACFCVILLCIHIFLYINFSDVEVVNIVEVAVPTVNVGIVVTYFISESLEHL